MGALVKSVIHAAPAHKFTFSGFALLCLAIILCSTGQLQAQETAVVLLEPQTITLERGQTSSVVVRIEGAADVYGVQIELSYDAGKINVLDVDEGKPGVQILAGDFLALDESFAAANEANNESGQLSYARTLLAPADPASGSGILVEFKVEAVETGSSDLLLGSLILASPEGAQLPVQLPGDNDEPKAAATETATPTATAAEDSLVTATPTAENSLTPSPTAESAIGAAPATASPVVGITQPPNAAETAALVASRDLSTSTVSVQTIVEEPDPTMVNQSTAEPTKVVRAAEIAAAAQPIEEEESIQSEELPFPAVTVIGQNSSVAEPETQAVTPAPATDNRDVVEGPIIATGLFLLVAALIALWFLRRLLTRS